jgi:adenylate kinase
MNLVVMGPQGSGKSTQAELLAHKLKLPHLQTGELYRQIEKENSSFGRKIKAILSKGQIVPDEEHNRILTQELAKSKYHRGFVLDGSPRTLAQAISQPFKVDQVFYLKVSDEENIKRLLKRGRTDDIPEIITERLKIYHQQTEPVLDFYRKLGILEEMNGERPIEDIFQDILGRLKK